ncbi:MAG TPA: hypothetical protein VMV69_26920 [Pirellulales bacterium]|nr:hypothetical protein [Pirellulales bacterium]
MAKRNDPDFSNNGPSAAHLLLPDRSTAVAERPAAPTSDKPVPPAAESAKVPAPRPPSVLDQAASILKSAVASEAEDQKISDQRAWSLYVAILRRGDDPEPGDAREMAFLMADLDISAAQAENDLKIVTQVVPALLDLISHREEAAAARAEAVAAFTEARRASELAVNAAGRARSSAEGRYAECAEAPLLLLKLSKERPQLFDRQSKPPRLRGDAKRAGADLCEQGK